MSIHLPESSSLVSEISKLNVLIPPSIVSVLRLRPSAAFHEIDRTLARFFVEKLQSSLSPSSPLLQKIEGVFLEGSWKSVEDGSKEQMALLQLYAKMIHLRGQMVKSYVTGSEIAKEEINFVGRIEYEHFGEIADVTNELFLKWLEEGGQILSTEERLERGFTNPFAAIRRNKHDEAQEIPWHKAYPTETSQLTMRYQILAVRLRLALNRAEAEDTPNEILELAQKKIYYYGLLSQAWTKTDTPSFQKADAFLPQQINDLAVPIHIHTIEQGYGRDRIQRIPEVSLRHPDAAHEAINRRALKTRQTMVETLNIFFADTDYSPEARANIDLVQRSNFAARHSMGAGMEMIFRPAGQILPNENTSRLEGGLDISVDPAAMGKRFSIMQEAYEAVFGERLPNPDLVEILGEKVASHEFGHAVGATPSTDARITPFLCTSFIEEWKATAGGMLLSEWLPIKKVSMDDLRRNLKNHMAASLRVLALRDEPHHAAYAREGILLFKIMEEGGMISRDRTGFCLDVSDEKVKALYETLLTQYKEVLKIYDSGTTEDLRNFLSHHLRPTPFTELCTEILDRHFGKNNMPTIAALCETRS